MEAGATQPKVSALRYYKLTGFSVEWLMKLWTPLDVVKYLSLVPGPPGLCYRRFRRTGRLRSAGRTEST